MYLVEWFTIRSACSQMLRGSLVFIVLFLISLLHPGNNQELCTHHLQYHEVVDVVVEEAVQVVEGGVTVVDEGVPVTTHTRCK